MSTKSEANWANAEASLPPELRPLLSTLRKDYLIAKDLHVPNFPGGPNAEILAELIRRGWRKPAD